MSYAKPLLIRYNYSDTYVAIATDLLVRFYFIARWRLRAVQTAVRVHNQCHDLRKPSLRKPARAVGNEGKKTISSLNSKCSSFDMVIRCKGARIKRGIFEIPIYFLYLFLTFHPNSSSNGDNPPRHGKFLIKYIK